MKMNCSHSDTCLPDYWSGHHLPHVQIVARNGMSFKSVRDAIRDELRQGAVMGSDDAARLLSADMVPPSEEKRADMVTRAAYAAINRDIRPAKKGARNAFPDLEELPSDCDGEECFAFFVFTIQD